MNKKVKIRKLDLGYLIEVIDLTLSEYSCLDKCCPKNEVYGSNYIEEKNLGYFVANCEDNLNMWLNKNNFNS